MTEPLYDRIARHLGWTLAETKSFTLLALREVVTDGKLRHHINVVLRSVGHITRR